MLPHETMTRTAIFFLSDQARGSFSTVECSISSVGLGGTPSPGDGCDRSADPVSGVNEGPWS